MKTKYRFWTKKEHDEFGRPYLGWCDSMNFLYGLPITDALYNVIKNGNLEKLKLPEKFFKEQLSAAGHVIDERHSYNWLIGMDMLREGAVDDAEYFVSASSSNAFLLL